MRLIMAVDVGKPGQQFGKNSTMRSLPHDCVGIWCFHLSDLAGRNVLHRYGCLLSEEERAQQQRFHFEADRVRYLVTRAVVRILLSQHSDQPPDHWRFSTNRYGRPVLENPCDALSDADFNISHSRQLVAVTLGKRRELGIDTENVHERLAPLEIAGRYFSPDETEALQALPKTQRQRRFFELWTLKESYLKAIGKGMAESLAVPRFSLEREGIVDFRTSHDSGNLQDRWSFWLLELGQGHLIALCAAAGSGADPKLVLRRIRPFFSEGDVDFRLLRRSSICSGGAAPLSAQE